MNDFKWKHFQGEIVLGCVRWLKSSDLFGLGKILRRLKEYEKPATINTDQAPSYAQAIRELKEEGLLDDNVFHRKVKYLNNLIEADHGKLRRLINPTLGFKSMKTAFATIKGFEVMRMFKKGQLNR